MTWRCLSPSSSQPRAKGSFDRQHRILGVHHEGRQVVGEMIADGNRQDGKDEEPESVLRSSTSSTRRPPPERDRRDSRHPTSATHAATRPMLFRPMTALRPGNSSGLMPPRSSHQKVRVQARRRTLWPRVSSTNSTPLERQWAGLRQGRSRETPARARSPPDRWQRRQPRDEPEEDTRSIRPSRARPARRTGSCRPSVTAE